MRRWFLWALALTVLLLPACGRATPPPTAAEVLSVMLSAAAETVQPIPDGVTRLTAADPTSPDRLTDTFFSALYGEAAGGLLGGDSTQGPPITDGALFLSVAPYPCELAVFRCSDGETARTVAALCRRRLDALERGFRGSEWEETAAGGRVAMEGNYVFLVLCEDPTPLLEAAARRIN